MAQTGADAKSAMWPTCEIVVDAPQTHSTHTPRLTGDWRGSNTHASLLEEGEVEETEERVGGMDGGDDDEVRGDDDEEEEDGVPYDRGWAWAVMAGNFVNYFMFAGYYKCVGLFYVELLRLYSAQATQAGLIFSLRAGVVSVSGMIVMNVVVVYLGVRKTVVIGALLMALSAILASAASQLMLIVCLMGILLGLGQSMLHAPGEVLMGQYFRERRMLAMSVAKCGASMGNIVMPLLVSFLLEQYSFSGTVLITGGLLLNCLPAAFLLRPTSFYRRNNVSSAAPLHKAQDRTQPRDADSMAGSLLANGSRHGKLDWTSRRPGCPTGSAVSPQSILAVHRHGSLKVSTLSMEAGIPSRDGRHLSLPSKLFLSHPDLSSPQEEVFQRRRLFSESVRRPSWKRRDSQARQTWNRTLRVLESGASESLSDVAAMVHASMQSLHRSAGRSEDGGPVKARPSCPCADVLDLSLFRSPLFRLLLAYYVLFPSANIMTSYLPAVASENGVTEQQTALMLSIIGGLDLVSRICCAVINGAKFLRVPTLLIISFSILGVTSQFVRLMTSYEHFMALSVVLGLLGGVANAMFPLVVVEFVGVERMGKALGFVLLIAGGSAAAAYPLLGHVRDTTGSYVAVYHVVGCTSLLAAGFLCCEKWVRRLEHSRTQHADL